MNAWLGPEEIKAIRKYLAHSLSFEMVAKKYSSRIEPVSSATWTHKCICPFHKNGEERTPSLHISETEKTFFCYGCSTHGDIFDFIGIIKGSPGEAVADKYQKSKNIDIDLSNIKAAKPKTNVQEINLQISCAIRDYLYSIKKSDIYLGEVEWADGIFKRIDERFDKLTDEDGDQAKNFYMQIMLELDRRKI